MKILSVLLLSAAAFSLASCGSTDTSTALQNHKGEGFSIDVPKTWVEKNKKEIPTPKNGSVALALTSTDITSGFANNLLILKDKLAPAEKGADKMTSKKYSIINHALTTGAYEEFIKLSESTITFTDADESNLYVFEAKYNRDTPKKRFVQTAKICGDQVFLITVGIELNSGTTSKYESLAKSFQCVK